MRTIFRASTVAVIVLLATQTGAASSQVRLISPAVAAVTETVVCQVINTDDSPHTITVTFYNHAGNAVTFSATVIVQPNGSNGLGIAGPNGVVHCEIIADGKADFYRATIEVRNGASTVMSLPIW